MNIRSLTGAMTVMAITMLPATAWAHGGAHAGFAAGLLHPLTGLDHLLAAFGIALWAGQLGGRARWLLPLLATTGLLAGFSLTAWLSTPAVLLESVIALSVISLGLLTMLRLSSPLLPAAFVAGGFMLFHGYIHAAEAMPGTLLWQYAGGLTITTLLIQALGLLIAALTQMTRFQALPRALGAAIAVAGVWTVAGVIAA